LKVEMWPIGKVKPYGNNPRKNEKSVGPVAKSIKKFGFRQPIVVDKTGVIIVGHTRWLAAQKLCLKTVPIHVAEMPDKMAKAYRIFDNKTAEIAEWDIKLLDIEMQEIDDIQIMDIDSGAKEQRSKGAKEYFKSDFDNMKHKCPKCGFEYE